MVDGCKERRTKTDNGISIQTMPTRNFTISMGLLIDTSDPTRIWSRTQLRFGLGPNSDLVSDPGLSEPGYSEDGYSEVTWNPVTPNTTIFGVPHFLDQQFGPLK